MERSVRLILAYIIFFTVCNLIVMVLFYLYGFFFEKKLRRVDQRIRLPEKLLFLFHFKGVFGQDRVDASRSGSLAQLGSIAYFLLMELICFAISWLKNDLVFPCQFALIMMMVFVGVGLVRFIFVNQKIRSNVKEADRVVVKNFVEETAVDKDEGEVADETEILSKSREREERMERVLDAIWEEENDHENETTDAQEGKTAVKKLESDVIGNDFEINKGILSESNEKKSKALKDIERSDSGTYVIPEFKTDFQEEFRPVFSGKSAAQEADDIAEGKKYLEQLKKSINGSDGSAQEGEVLKNIKRSDSGTYVDPEFKNDFQDGFRPVFTSTPSEQEANEISEGKKYLEQLKNDVIGEDYEPMFNDPRMFKKEENE